MFECLVTGNRFRQSSVSNGFLPKNSSRSEVLFLSDRLFSNGNRSREFPREAPASFHRTHSAQLQQSLLLPHRTQKWPAVHPNSKPNDHISSSVSWLPLPMSRISFDRFQVEKATKKQKHLQSSFFDLVNWICFSRVNWAVQIKRMWSVNVHSSIQWCIIVSILM